MSTVSLPLELKSRHLAPVWIAVVVATVFYCELSRFAQDQPPAELAVALLWNVKVWTVWILATLMLAIRSGRAMACAVWGRPFLRGAMLVLLPSLALGFECKVGGLFDAAGWLGQPESLTALLYKRLPLFAVALPTLGVFIHGARQRDSWAPPQRALPTAQPGTLTVATSRGTVSIAVAEIEAIIAAGNYVELCLVDGRQFLHRATLTSMCDTLNVASLVRVHRSAIVNRDHVVARLPQGRLRLRSGRVVRVGRAFRSELAV
jgi:hypothetical protein